MTNATADLNDLQRKVYQLLLAHRYYNDWTRQPTVALQQNWIARTLNVQQSDVSAALQELRNARRIVKCGTPRQARPQIYFLTDSELEGTQRPHTDAWRHIDPDPEVIKKTATPLKQERRENAAYEIKP